MCDGERLYEILTRISELAAEGVSGETVDSGGGDGDGGRDGNGSEGAGDFGCVIKSLPQRLLIKAAEIASQINPVNSPAFGLAAGRSETFEPMDPLAIAMITQKYWGAAPRTLSVSFMESTPAALKSRIISHLNAWNSCCGIKFAATNGTGTIRISRGAGGYYSYLGTDVTLIPTNRQTMNLENFSMSTPESEYKRVVRHEAGHTLGFPHEHARKGIVARIDPAKAYKWFWDTYGWNKAMVDAQVLTSLSEASLMGTPPDQTSIMCYQLPGKITKDGKPILGGTDINTTDCKFAGKVYPRSGQALSAPGGEPDDEWQAEDDVDVEAALASI